MKVRQELIKVRSTEEKVILNDINGNQKKLFTRGLSGCTLAVLANCKLLTANWELGTGN